MIRFTRNLIIYLLFFSLTFTSCEEKEVNTNDKEVQSTKAYSGIICLLSNPQSDPALAFEMPYIDGVKLRLGWQNIEKSRGVFDWSLIDRYVDEARQRDKLLSLSIAGGSTSPAWLINMLDESEYITARGRSVPILWNETYVSEYLRFVEAFGDRYADEKYLSHVTISGIGFTNEPVIPPPFGVENLDDWALAAFQIVDAYINHFPGKPLSLVVYTQIPSTDTWDFFKENILEPMYENSETVGLEYHGLNATASPDEGTIADNYYLEIKNIADSRTTGYQFVCSSIGNEVCEPEWLRGSSNNTENLLKRTLDAGIANGADFIEVYANDCADSVNYELFKNASERMKGHGSQ